MATLYARQKMENIAFKPNMELDEERSWVLEKGEGADENHPARRIHPAPILWSFSSEEALKTDGVYG